MKKKKIIAVILVLIFIALLFGVGYFVYVYTGEFTTDFKTFYLKIGRNKYVKDTYDLSFTDTRIEVHYTFEFFQTKKPTFNYTLEPTGENFQFTVDGERVNWLSVDGLTQAFNVNADSDGITLECANKSISKVLQSIYPNSEIVLPENIDTDISRYKLTVISEDERVSISLTFKCSAVVQNITLDPPRITF